MMVEEKKEKVTGEGVDFDRYWYPAGSTEPVLRPEVAAKEKEKKRASKKNSTVNR
jgi:hypothetical protein